MGIPLLSLEVAGLVSLSAVCSGLNVAIMALQPSDLRRKAKLGDPRAKRVLPLRRKIHLTLAALLLTNVAVISATSLVLDEHLAGLMAGILSTLLIVVFGEVVPQAVFAKRALTFTALFSPMLHIMIVVTYPISKPLQIILDRIVGHERRTLHSRNELGLLISEHLGSNASELDEDEVEIIRSTLQLSEKRVRDIMTPIEDVFWLTPADVIDKKLVNKIKRQGRSRLPIFNTSLTKCYGVLLVKELVNVNFDDAVYHPDDFPLHPVSIVGSMTALDTMFRKFISAHTHLIPIERDDTIVGIVTIEDVIEEIIGHEIEDETDRATQAGRKK